VASEADPDVRRTLAQCENALASIKYEVGRWERELARLRERLGQPPPEQQELPIEPEEGNHEAGQESH
jgi:hypothetical protein